MMSHYISLDGAEDTDTAKQMRAQRSSRVACRIRLGVHLGPGGTGQSMRIPVKPKQSACARGHSLGGCYTATEQTAAYWVSRYYPRSSKDTVHFHIVCREGQHKKALLCDLAWSDRNIKLAQQREETRLRTRCKDTRRGTSPSPWSHANQRGEENVSVISFNTTLATTWFDVNKAHPVLNVLQLPNYSSQSLWD